MPGMLRAPTERKETKMVCTGARKVIVPFTVAEILNEQISQKLA